ncbi:hypothetical protein EV121DRAFT_218429 [Schizophyllum commune]
MVQRMRRTQARRKERARPLWLSLLLRHPYARGMRELIARTHNYMILENISGGGTLN